MKRITLLFLLLISLLTKAQNYNFARFDNTNGLSNNQVECIFKDSRGFIWFGTNHGLNRYDSYEVKVYKTIKNDTTSILFNSIRDIQEDTNGNLWLKGNEFYVVYDIKTEKFNRNPLSVIKSLGINFTPIIVEIDKSKNYYFYDLNKGVYKYDVTRKKLTSYLQSNKPNTLSRGNIVSIKPADGCFWVLYQSGIIERMNETTNSIDFRNSYVTDNSPGAILTKEMFIDAEGCPWIYPGKDDKGALYYNFNTSEWIFFGCNKLDFKKPTDCQICSDFVHDITQESNGKIWIATDHGGVSIFDKLSGTVKTILHDPENPNSLSQNSAISLYYDNTGIMWVGTYKHGVSYYHPGMFKFEKSPLYFYQNPNLENKDCNSLYVDGKKNLWIGTNGSGLLHYTPATGQFRHFKSQKDNASSISSDIIISTTEDKSGNMWFGTFLGGLNQMKGDNFIRYKTDVNNSNSISNNSIYGLVCDDNNNLWIGTLGAGIDKLDANRKLFSRNVRGLSSSYVLSMYSKDFTRIYVSTSTGVDLLNIQTGTITSVFKNQETKNKLSDAIIFNTLLDSRNLIWIATNNGINIYNPETNSIEYLKMSDGLPSEQVVSLVEDNNHNIWAGTRNGLACIYVSTNKDNFKLEYNVVAFDENDGLLSSIFNQNSIFKDEQGKIYIGCTRGYTVFDPNTIQFNQIVPKPKFCSLHIGNHEIVPGMKYKNREILNASISGLKRIVLNYDEKNFTIHFSAMSFIHPEKNRYRYKLKGLDNDWMESKNGIATYSNLNQGSYQLKVYASNNDNIWSSEPLILQIVVRPPWWRTWWAASFYLLMIIGLIWYIVNYNLRKQKQSFENEQQMREARQLHEMDEMKFRFFTNISHEFRTPLTLILNPVEKLQKEIDHQEHKNLLNIIHRNANGLLELVNQLLDFRKLDVKKDALNISIGDVVMFIREICYSFTEMANKKAINFAFSTTVTELKMEFDPEKLRKIVYNLLSNAFKFTPEKGKIEVSISLVQRLNEESKQLKISVLDTGIGIPEKDLDKVFDRFYRVENPENGHQTGTGVGLHIVNEYVQLHNGEVKVESTPGKGSEFIVLIPALQQVQQEILSQNYTVESEELPVVPIVESEENGSRKEGNSKMPLMLIVDDNEDFREFIASIFYSTYRIISAPDGEVALAMTLKHIPDLVVCDVMMPKMDGYEYCRNVKNDIRISQIPIILLTAKTGDENKYRGLEAGAEDYISKPFNTEMLTLKVSKIIERRRQTQDQFKRKVDINPSEIEITSMDEKFVKKAVLLVEANIDNTDFLVEDLCREMGMSRVYFYKKILALTDKTPSEFIRFIRLKRAADLLERSQLYVNEVAYQVGFNDPKYFRKYFKEEFGMSPNEYKKKFEK
ncbi:MAG TPA: two-component regulator propeller domain-containing protein [Paludibacter sp.]|nr:two-component regulator propeller domain-containing protein [Paludibacter sp.]